MLARYETHQRIVDAVRETFRVEITVQKVNYYNPSTVNGQELSKELKALFDSERKQFLKNVENIPIANKAVRLGRLDRMALKAESQGNIVAAAQMMEQAAKEVGGLYTNKQRLEHDIPPGGNIGGLLARVMGAPLPVVKKVENAEGDDD